MLKLDPKNTELLNQKQTVLNQSISATEDKLKELKDIKTKADEEMANGTEINEANYRALQREIINTENKLKSLKLEASNWTQVGKKLEEAGTSISNVGQSIEKVGDSATKKLTLPLTAIAGLGLKYNAEIEKYTKSFENFLGSAEKAKKAVDDIKKDASRTPFDVTSLVRANQMLISTGENAGDARETILALGDAVTATGGGNDELTRMASNLQQIRNAGKATSMDIRQFAYAGIDVYGILADYLGKTTQEVKDMEISYDDLSAALKRANSQGGKYYNAMSNSSETLTGQTNQLIAETKEFVGELTKGLVPIAKKVLDKAKDMLRSFQNLSDSEKENALRIGLMVAAAGPLIKIFGTLTTGAGKAIKGIGMFSQAIGVMKTGAESSNASVNTLAKLLKGLTSPTGLAVMGITAVAGALVYLATKQTEEEKQIKELCENVGNARKELDEYNKKVDETANAELSHIDYIQKLKNELDTLVDENGNVKDSEEARAKFIIEQLNGALGSELELTDGQIKNYQTLQGEIDKLIEKKRAEIKLSAEEDKYKNALEKQSEAVENLKKALDLSGLSYTDASKKAQEYMQKVKDGKISLDDLKNSTMGWAVSFAEADDQVRTHTEAIKQYETDYARFTEEKYSEIGKSIKDSTQDWTDTTLNQINTSLSEQGKSMDLYKQIYEETGNEVAKESQEQAKNNIDTLVNQLNERTTTLGTMSKDEIQAWATLASEDRTKFNEVLDNVANEDVKNQLQAIGIAIDQNSNLTTDEMGILADALEERFTSMDSNEWGADLITGLATGIRQKAQTVLNKTVQDVASSISNFLHFSRPDEGPLRDYETWMPDMIKGLSKSLINASPILEKTTEKLGNKIKNSLNIADFSDYNALNNKIIDSTQTVFTTPQIVFNVQELDEAKLQQCFNYINKKFGSAY